MRGRWASREASGTPRPAAREVRELLWVNGENQDPRRSLHGLSVAPLSSGFKGGGRASGAALAVSPGTSELGGGGGAAEAPRQEPARARGSLAGPGSD